MNCLSTKTCWAGCATLAALAYVAPANAFTVFGPGDELAYQQALTNAGLVESSTETFDGRISAGDTITFSNGVTSTMVNRGGGNDNRVNNEYFGSLGRNDSRSVTWNFPSGIFPSGINAFSFRIQGATPSKDLSISGLFDGPGGGTQTVSLNDDADIQNASYSFFGIVGMGSFDEFTFFDGISSNNGNDFNFKVDDFSFATPGPPQPVPTPALLPGLIGMGAAALRRRKQTQGC